MSVAASDGSVVCMGDRRRVGATQRIRQPAPKGYSLRTRHQCLASAKTGRTRRECCPQGCHPVVCREVRTMRASSPQPDPMPARRRHRRLIAAGVEMTFHFKRRCVLLYRIRRWFEAAFGHRLLTPPATRRRRPVARRIPSQTGTAASRQKLADRTASADCTRRLQAHDRGDTRQRQRRRLRTAAERLVEVSIQAALAWLRTTTLASS
jgi:hypothetical protein